MTLGMASRKALAPLLLLGIFAAASQLQKSIAAVYKVGDSAGWTTIGNINYKQWAANKSFKPGDVILFSYNPQFHNVMQVTHPEYQACNATAPIATHTSGNDSITITTRGHHFFLCGVPGHCLSGQKVDINVPRTTLAPTPSVTPTTGTDSTVPSPSPSAASTLCTVVGTFGKLTVSVAVFAAFVSSFA
ncbi:hypothetical protein Vadar_012636 [Vaccinium darrowii]|uniref:Uncharacterized protein n=1 Tax=Vaccinium darrowii TaxID=229202 RepID=A0ACB7XQB7_9ERIC|nr:hypothetical protein Vadar_012636 [Vaccinium darrowii]